MFELYKKDHILVVGGDIIISALSRSKFALFSTLIDDVTEIRFEQVNKADSTGVSLLLEARRKKGFVIKISNIPHQIQSLVKLYGVEELIGI